MPSEACRIVCRKPVGSFVGFCGNFQKVAEMAVGKYRKNRRVCRVEYPIPHKYPTGLSPCRIQEGQGEGCSSQPPLAPKYTLRVIEKERTHGPIE